MLKRKQLNSGKRVNVYLGLSVVCVAFTILKLSTYKFSSSDESLVGKSGTFQQVEMNKTLPLDAFNLSCGSQNNDFIPRLPYASPEYNLFQFHPGSASNCLPVAPSSKFFGTLPEVLRICVALNSCTGVKYNSTTSEGTLCQRHKVNALQNILVRNDCSILAVRRTNERYVSPTGELAQCNCPPGLIPFQLGGLGETCSEISCEPCLKGMCKPLKKLKLIPQFDARLQNFTQTVQLSDSYRAFNPVPFYYGSEYFAAFRISNFTFCPWLRTSPTFHAMLFDSSIGICALDRNFYPNLSRCHVLPVDVLSILPRNFMLHHQSRGLEDPRPVIVNGMPHIIAALYTGNSSEQTQIHQVILKLDDDLRSVSRAVLISDCYEGQAPKQKNWMPLVVNEELYLVMQLAPLTIIRPDLNNGECTIAYEEKLNYIVRPSYLAVGAPELRGGSNFINIAPDIYLGVVHAVSGRGFKYLFYYHYLVVLERRRYTFGISWISEAFRFPRDVEMRQSKLTEKVRAIQFGVGLHKDGDDLYFSFGDADCKGNLAIFPQFFQLLPEFLDGSTNTQNMVRSLFNENIRPEDFS